MSDMNRDQRRANAERWQTAEHRHRVAENEKQRFREQKARKQAKKVARSKVGRRAAVLRSHGVDV